MNFCITCPAEHRLAEARQCAEQCELTLVEQPALDNDYILVFGEDVRLCSSKNTQGDIRVDFCEGSAAHRRKFGGGKGQLIAKAVGLKSGCKPPVFDMTAGLGADAFVLACLGCPVTMLERNPVIYALLVDGLSRARHFAQQHDPDLLEIISRMTLLPGNSIEWLQKSQQSLSVIYLDPMFPERKKSASVKKEMQAFHGLVGDDADAANLLDAALAVAEHRVVVKRPRIAPGIAGREPSFKLAGKSSRYDIYALKSLSKRPW